MSSAWHNEFTTTHPDEISTPAKSPGWHRASGQVIWITWCLNFVMASGWLRRASQVIRMTYSISHEHPVEIRPGANSSGWRRFQITLPAVSHLEDIGQHRKSSGLHSALTISHSHEIRPGDNSSKWLTLTVLRHLDGTRHGPKVIRITLLMTVSHPDELWPMHYVIRMT